MAGEQQFVKPTGGSLTRPSPDWIRATSRWDGGNNTVQTKSQPDSAHFH